MNHVLKTQTGTWAIRYNLAEHGWQGIRISDGMKTKVFHSQKRLLDSLICQSRVQKKFFQSRI